MDLPKGKVNVPLLSSVANDGDVSLEPNHSPSPAAAPWSISRRSASNISSFEKDAEPGRVVILNRRPGPPAKKFCTNFVSTAKYTWWNFVPKNLFDQFKRTANTYFLVVALLNLVPGLGVVSPAINFAPLLFVLVTSAAREAFEDYKRYRSDDSTNNRRVGIISRVCKPKKGSKSSQYVPLSDESCCDAVERIENDESWKNLKVGDLVRIRGGEMVPADLLLLSTSSEGGLSYVETANLDGETNLKVMEAVSATTLITSLEEMARISGAIECELPNKHLGQFEGRLSLDSSPGRLSLDSSPGRLSLDSSPAAMIPLNAKQLLLRGTKLMNTDWIIGVVLYTGKETKVMQNQVSTPMKRSQIERLMNSQIIVIFLLQVCLCLLGAFPFLKVINPGHWYLLEGNRQEWVLVIIRFLMFFILFSNLIPISLYVSLEMVKVVQAYFINNDRDMYDEESDTPAKANTSNLNEDLGQIKYIFTDKTGTLTQNKMIFVKFSAGGVVYGSDIVDHKKPPMASKGKGPCLDEVADSPLYTLGQASPAVEFSHPDFHSELHGENQAQIVEFLTILSVCHTVIPEKRGADPTDVFYNSASPDETALVMAAKSLGFFFHERTARGVKVSILGVVREFEVLHVLEFNSTRKRMSVIVKDSDGRIVLMCKGADSVIYARLTDPSLVVPEKTLEHLEEFALEGYRTLTLARRVLTTTEYEDWHKRYTDASASLKDREEKCDDLADEIEHKLTLIGATAIEDKLQVGVPETLDKLGKAGIQICVLTGDKQQTAINIGFTCNLLKSDMILHVVNEEGSRATRIELEKILTALRGDTEKKRALVIDGGTITYIFEDEEISEIFKGLLMTMKVIICCRVSPLQKALVVKLCKNADNGGVTLAIGDGANDVGMIQEAHIGVGISGEEGMQAANTSDYAIAQFRFLARLLLVHGRWSYRRNAFLVLYCFYKNVAATMCVFWFSCFSAMSAQSLYEDWMISLYNMGFTGFPVLFFGIMDQDISAEMALQYPSTYISGQKNTHFNLRLLWAWIVSGLWHSAVIFLAPLVFFQDSQVELGVWELGGTVYSVVIITVSFKLLLYSRHLDVPLVFSVLLSIISWFALFLAYRLVPENPMSGVAEILVQKVSWYAILLLLPAFCLLPDYVVLYCRRQFFPDRLAIVQERQRLGIMNARSGALSTAARHARLALQFTFSPGAIATGEADVRGFGFSQEEGSADMLKRHFGGFIPTGVAVRLAKSFHHTSLAVKSFQNFQSLHDYTTEGEVNATKVTE